MEDARMVGGRRGGGWRVGTCERLLTPRPPLLRGGGEGVWYIGARVPQGGDTLVFAEGRLVVFGSRIAREGAQSPGERACLTLGYCPTPLRGVQMEEWSR